MGSVGFPLSFQMDYPRIGLACDGSAVPEGLQALCDQRWSTGKSQATPFSWVPFDALGVGRWDANFATWDLGWAWLWWIMFIIFFWLLCMQQYVRLHYIYLQRWDSVDGQCLPCAVIPSATPRWLKTCPAHRAEAAGQDLRHDRLTWGLVPGASKLK